MRKRGLVPAAILLLGCSAQRATEQDISTFLTAAFPEQAGEVLGGEALSGDAAHGARIALPDEGSLPVRLTLGEVTIAVREVGTSGPPAPLGRAVRYQKGQGASIWRANREGYEEWLYLPRGAAKAGGEVASWHVEGARLWVEGEGVSVGDARGELQWRVTAPRAFAERGRAVRVKLDVTGERLSLSVDPTEDALLIDPAWVPAAPMASWRKETKAALLPGGDVLVVGGDSHYQNNVEWTTAERYHPALDAWSQVAWSGLTYPTITPIVGGDVLIVGGYKNVAAPWGDSSTQKLVFRYDAALDVMSPAMPMLHDRREHTASPLHDGRVLVAGGRGHIVSLNGNQTWVYSYSRSTAEIYDPNTDTWAQAAAMAHERTGHVAVTLASGKVLVACGSFGNDEISELYEPLQDRWTSSAPLAQKRLPCAAAVLSDGKVLVVGGAGATAEVYDPDLDNWSAAPSMNQARSGCAATLLQSGKVLVTGGGSATAEIFDPSAGTWTMAPNMALSRTGHAAVLLDDGKVLIAGGTNLSPSTEIYDPASPIGSACVAPSDCASGFCADGVCCDTACNAGACDACSVVSGAAADGACTLLTGPSCDDGDSCTSGDTCQAGVCAGAPMPNGSSCDDGNPCTMADVCSAGQCAGSTAPNGAPCDDGDACSVGDTCQAGQCQAGMAVTCTALDSCHEAGVCDPATGVCSTPCAPQGTFCVPGEYDGICKLGACLYGTTWSPANGFVERRLAAASVVLADGRVLTTGGYDNGSPYATAHLYDPMTNTWSPAASMSAARWGHTATLLTDGTVLVTGGNAGPGKSAIDIYSTADALDGVEIYHPSTNTWAVGPGMNKKRYGHTATLLASNKVLVVGDGAQIYDPLTATWAPTSPMNAAHAFHTATLLQDGKVFVYSGAPLRQPPPFPPLFFAAEVYDPALNQWTKKLENLLIAADARYGHAATLLPSGEVLITGGVGILYGPYPQNFCHTADTPQLYDPATSLLTPTGAMSSARYGHGAALLTDGSVIVAGGYSNGELDDICKNGYVITAPPHELLSSADRYDPATNTWSPIKPLIARRLYTTLLTLGSGDVLAVGGSTNLPLSAERYDGPSCASGHWVDGVCCDTPCDGPCEACSVTAGAPMNGVCSPISGGACDDGDACTQGDVCVAGVCSGSPLVCVAPDECHEAGSCSGGACAHPPVPDGTPCQGGVCSGGTCVPGTSSSSGVGGGMASSSTGGVGGGMASSSTGGVGGGMASSSTGGVGGGMASSSTGGVDGGMASSSGGDGGSGGSGGGDSFGGCGCRAAEGRAGGMSGVVIAAIALLARRRGGRWRGGKGITPRGTRRPS